MQINLKTKVPSKLQNISNTFVFEKFVLMHTIEHNCMAWFFFQSQKSILHTRIFLLACWSWSFASIWTVSLWNNRMDAQLYPIWRNKPNEEYYNSLWLFQYTIRKVFQQFIPTQRHQPIALGTTKRHLLCSRYVAVVSDTLYLVPDWCGGVPYWGPS